MQDNRDVFWETVAPDVDQEVDRICMILMDMSLQNWARNRPSYLKEVQRVRDTLYGAPSEDAPSPVFYPAQHLCYWFEVRADYWGRVDPAVADAETMDAFATLLASARHIQTIVHAKAKATKGKARSEEQGQAGAEALEGQKQSIDAVLTAMDPGANRKSSPPRSRP
jgi:hypothetical protein